MLFSIGGAAPLGCQHTPIDLTQGPAPLRMPRPGEEPQSFEDSLTGGQVFSMYCAQCHNARALAERPFSNYQNVAAHMRVRANLTGVEYEKLLTFLRRWHDGPSPVPDVEPSPKRLIYSQPIAELRDQAADIQPAPPEQPQPLQAPGPERPQPVQVPDPEQLRPIQASTPAQPLAPTPVGPR